MPGVVHTRGCPTLEPVHCAPCLYALMTGRDEEPHGCDQVTTLAVDGIRVVIVTQEMGCLCRCPRAEESDA